MGFVDRLFQLGFRFLRAVRPAEKGAFGDGGQRTNRDVSDRGRKKMRVAQGLACGFGGTAEEVMDHLHVGASLC